ncbi:PREDICTED: rho-related GTP-binding protein RhoF-like [Charadrius vociferus]|uniref:rho-related GTP-binding protein RhoF-like n=1 Tax=Charadrius vociferus TaxID=50402 RepID=UPI0005219200|nr:PREDICTED: rho-related GTP-binding protein RhoF-like [Charadrius vociferus]
MARASRRVTGRRLSSIFVARQVYVPTVFEKYTASLQVGGKPVKIHLWDTAGQEDYDRLRPLSYSDANVVLICFDVTNPNSYDNVLTKWYPEVNHFCKGIPVLVVGCKTDLRKQQEGHLEPISYQKGEAMARQVRAVSYLECSARYQENIGDIFVEACGAALSAQRRKRRKTAVLECPSHSLQKSRRWSPRKKGSVTAKDWSVLALNNEILFLVLL